MAKSKITITTEIDFEVSEAAKWFWGLDDEQQADFFIEVAKVAASDTASQCVQWARVSGHLRSCKCSTTDAREMIRTLASDLGADDFEMGRDLVTSESQKTLAPLNEALAKFLV